MRKCIILLPENPEPLLEEEGKELVRQISKAKKLFNENHFSLFYDPENFKRFSQQLENWGEYLEAQLFNLRRSISKTAISISQNPAIDFNASYFKWNLFDGGHGEIAKLEYPVYQYAVEVSRDQKVSIIIVFSPGSYSTEEKLIGYKDSKLDSELPDRFSHIDVFNSSELLATWFDEIYSPKFSLEDTDRFDPTSKDVQGARVYKEKEQVRYWYLDNFHKSHYEVFNSIGDHLGEANIDGQLDPTKKDKNKKYKT